MQGCQKAKLLRYFNNMAVLSMQKEDESHQFEIAKKLLLVRLGDLYNDINSNYEFTPAEKIWRIEIPLNPIDPLDWLWQQPFAEKIYWQDREQEFEMAGVGIADLVLDSPPIDYSALFARLRKTLSISHNNIRYYGGGRFNSAVASDAIWSIFGSCRFIVPRFELFRNKNITHLAFNFVRVSNNKTQSGLEEFEEEIHRVKYKKTQNTFTLPEIQWKKDIPDRVKWKENVLSALRIIEVGELQKIVLSRKSTYGFNKKLDAILLLKKLEENIAPVYNFYFQPKENIAFMGVTPEQLYLLHEGQIYSEAIAGTIARGGDGASDKRLEEELLNSDKEIIEHRWVSKIIKSTLQGFCYSVDTMDQEVILKLLHLQHLCSRFRGRLRNDIDDGDIIASLHPTPAVGGYPQHTALQKIAEIDGYDRGWYAGPVGWIANNSAEFAVAIRSALISGKTISIFAGAGIVAGSDSQAEWDEIENKMQNYSRILNKL